MGHPSVAVVVYNKTTNKLVLVKQLRPAVLFTELMNDASIATIDDMAKANDALKGRYSENVVIAVIRDICHTFYKCPQLVKALIPCFKIFSQCLLVF